MQHWVIQKKKVAKVNATLAIILLYLEVHLVSQEGDEGHQHRYCHKGELLLKQPWLFELLGIFWKFVVWYEVGRDMDFECFKFSMNISLHCYISYQIGYQLIVLLWSKMCKMYNQIDVIFNKRPFLQLLQTTKLKVENAWTICMLISRTLIKLDVVKDFFFFFTVLANDI